MEHNREAKTGSTHWGHITLSIYNYKERKKNRKKINIQMIKGERELHEGEIGRERKRRWVPFGSLIHV